MPRYTLSFLSNIGQIIEEQTLDFVDDEDAIEIANIFDYFFGIRIWMGNREVGTVWKGPQERSICWEYP